MKLESWKILSIVGVVLLLNSLVFFIIILSTHNMGFWGVGIGCLIAALVLLSIGLIQKNRLKEKTK